MKKNFLNYIKSELLKIKENNERKKEEKRNQIREALDKPWTDAELKAYNLNYCMELSIATQYFVNINEAVFKTVEDAKRNMLMQNKSLFTDEEFKEYLDKLNGKKLIK